MTVKRCARCGRRLTAATPRVYSRWTHSYYCAAVKVCAKHAARKRGHRVTASSRSHLGTNTAALSRDGRGDSQQAGMDGAAAAVPAPGRQAVCRADIAYRDAREQAIDWIADGQSYDRVRNALLDEYRDALWSDEIDSLLDDAVVAARRRQVPA